MSSHPAELRALAFGTLDGSLWGAVLDRGIPALVIGTDAGSTSAEGVAPGLQWGESGDGAWTLSGDGVALTAAPLSAPEAADPPPPADGPVGDDAPPARPRFVPQPPPQGAADQQLCRVTGTVTVGGQERTVDCVGTRLHSAGKPVGSAASARLTAAWFAEDQAVALLALRPAKGESHEHETLEATLFDADGWIPVMEPRLSTTYDGAGTPRSAGLELWISDGEHEYPRRLAGEVHRESAAAAAPGLQLSVTPLRCHSRGQDGPGVYVLARFAD